MIPNGYDPKTDEKLLKFLEEQVGFENYGNAIERGLDRIRPLFQKYLSQWKGKVITVAGTNGKGETVLYLRDIFKHHKKTFSLWMSPHILSLKERFQNEQGYIEYDDLSSLFDEIQHEEKELGIKLSFYEFLFLAFIKNAFKRSSEFLILEVGLGGRLDAVNLFDSEVVGLTSIGRDHQKFLGDTLLKILHEKLGVIREGKLIFSAFESSYLRSEAKKKAFEKFAFLLDLVEAQVINPRETYSERNWKMAKILAKEFLGPIDLNRICLNRFPSIEQKKTTFDFKNAHNPEGFRSLVSELCSTNENYDVIVLGLSMRSEKDLHTMIKSLLAYTCNNAKIYLTPFNGQKALPEHDVKALSEYFSLGWIQDWKSFFNSEEVDNKKILITGSNYFLGAVYQYYNSLQ